MPNVNDALQFSGNFLGFIAGAIAFVLVVVTRTQQPEKIRREVDNEFERQLAEDAPSSVSGSHLPRSAADPSRTYMNQRFQRVRDDLRREFGQGIGALEVRVNELERNLGVDELRQARDASERTVRVLDEYRTAKEDFLRASALVEGHTGNIALLTQDVELLKLRLAELERALTDMRNGVGASDLVRGLLQEMARIIMRTIAPASMPAPGVSAHDDSGRADGADVLVDEHVVPQDLAEPEQGEPGWPLS